MQLIFSFGSEVVKIGSYIDTDYFMAFTRDGAWHYLHTGRMEDMVSTIFSDCTSDNVKEFVVGDGYCVTLPYGSNRVTVYRIAKGAGVNTFHEGEDTYRQARLNADGTYIGTNLHHLRSKGKGINQTAVCSVKQQSLPIFLA